MVHLFFCCVFSLTSVGDRNNYAAARLQGLEEDLNLTPQQYQTGLSILFVAYILMQVPSNLLLNYVGRPSLYLGFFTTAWGLVSTLTALVKNYEQIVACRFLLGLVGRCCSIMCVPAQSELDINQIMMVFRGSLLRWCFVLPV